MDYPSMSYTWTICFSKKICTSDPQDLDTEQQVIHREVYIMLEFPRVFASL